VTESRYNESTLRNIEMTPPEGAFIVWMRGIMVKNTHAA